jgi:hypothetical protein
MRAPLIAVEQIATAVWVESLGCLTLVANVAGQILDGRPEWRSSGPSGRPGCWLGSGWGRFSRRVGGRHGLACRGAGLARRVGVVCSRRLVPVMLKGVAFRFDGCDGGRR